MEANLYDAQWSCGLSTNNTKTILDTANRPGKINLETS